jgi:FkbM family methyltransferase
MKTVAGWHCPDLLSGPGNYLNKNGDARGALDLLTASRTAIQAGGHIGTWPVILSPIFRQVVTFEPEAENFACLAANLAERTPGNVFPVRGVLAEQKGPLQLRVSPKSTGQHRIGEGIFVPAFRIDDLGLDDVDAIFLDVEGFEIPALQGARKTIARSRPVIMAEENRRTVDQGFRIGDLERLLRGWGYRKVAAINEDLIFAPGPHP